MGAPKICCGLKPLSKLPSITLPRLNKAKPASLVEPLSLIATKPLTLSPSSIGKSISLFHKIDLPFGSSYLGTFKILGSFNQIVFAC